MIIWLASYPKSGNTWIRIFLNNLFYSNEDRSNINSLKIGQFPNRSHFNDLTDNLDDIKEFSQNCINAQEKINLSNQTKFFKTHHAYWKSGKNTFTNNLNSLGVIYIVRDPRNIVTSFTHHFQQTPKQSLESLLSHQYLGEKSEKHALTYVGSWKYHYNSWKVFENYNRYLLIRYEDLISDTEQTFLKILKFVSHLGKKKFTLETDKFRNSLSTTQFDKMQKLEASESFDEAKINFKTGQTIKFFNLGVKNDWNKILDPEIKKSLEKELQNELKELKYIS